MAKKKEELLTLSNGHQLNMGAIRRREKSWERDLQKNGVMYLIFLPILIYFFILHYLPMFGIVASFQNFKLSKGYFGSEWVGLENFRELFTGAEFGRAVRNTVIIGLINMAISFPAPIVFALIVTNIRLKRSRRVILTMSYMPNFVAPVVITAFLVEFCSRDGIITTLMHNLFGYPLQNMLADPNPPTFWLVYAFSGMWQGFGYGSIIYVTALNNISGDYYEAAAIDGANRWQRIWYISLPCIKPMIIMMLTMQIGVVFRAGFDRVLLLYTPGIYEVSDNLFTYTYRMAFGKVKNYGLSSASGLFQSIVGTIMLFASNAISKKLSGSSLF